MAWKVPDHLRIQLAAPWPQTTDGENGVFALKNAEGYVRIIAAKGDGWEHVSVSHAKKTPSWATMCQVKALFWDDDTAVMQVHPPASDYVNFHPHCLHMWRPEVGEIPLPPSWMVGPK